LRRKKKLKSIKKLPPKLRKKKLKKPVKAKVKKGKPLKRKKFKGFPSWYLPLRDSPKEALAKIKSWLESAADCIQGYGASSTVKIGFNSDNTIDGQLNIEDIPRGPKILRNLLIDSEGCVITAIGDIKKIVNDYFCQAGVDIKSKEAYESIDRRYRGLNRYNTYWYRLPNFFKMMEGLRGSGVKTRRKNKGIIVNVSSKRDKPFRIWIRIHWNILDVTPGQKHEGKGPKR
jgi:hypothetical protein